MNIFDSIFYIKLGIIMKILNLIEKIPDPREINRIQHPLPSILFITLCAALCKAESWHDVQLYGECKYDWLKKYISLPNGIPSQWTFRKVFTLLPPKVLETLLIEHASSIVKEKEDQIAVDGKALKGTKDKNSKILQSVSAWSTKNDVVLAETAVDKKSNEITAIPELIKLLELNGCTVTIDAMGCQKAIVKQIIDNDADYVLGLKKNHPKLYKSVSEYMQSNAINKDHCLSDGFDHSHGRLTRRRYFSIDSSNVLETNDWESLNSLIAVETITSSANKNVTAEWRYYISSHNYNNGKIPEYVRGHWGIENKLHWVLDVNLGEDADKKIERNSAKAFGVLKRIALNIVRTKDSGSKGSLRGKLKKAGWDNEYLIKLLK
jgi:predicted transposase YbfD/YdcC